MIIVEIPARGTLTWEAGRLDVEPDTEAEMRALIGGAPARRRLADEILKLRADAESRSVGLWRTLM